MELLVKKIMLILSTSVLEIKGVGLTVDVLMNLVLFDNKITMLKVCCPKLQDWLQIVLIVLVQQVIYKTTSVPEGMYVLLVLHNLDKVVYRLVMIKVTKPINRG